MKKFLAVIAVMSAFCVYADNEQHLTYDDFIRGVEAGNIRSVVLDRYSSINGMIVEGGHTNAFRSYVNTGSAGDPLLARFLKEHNVEISMQDIAKPRYGMSIFSGLIFLGTPIVFLVFLVLIMKKLNLILLNQRIGNQQADINKDAGQ